MSRNPPTTSPHRAGVHRLLAAAAVPLLALTTAACSETRTPEGFTAEGEDETQLIDEPVEVSTVVVIGDSLTEGSEPAIAEALPAAGYEPLLIDGWSGRRSSVDAPGDGPNGGVDAIAGALDGGHTPDAWVVALGTNDVLHYDGDGYASIIDEILDALPPDAPLVWVDVYLRDVHDRETAFNTELDGRLADRPQTVIARWTDHAWREDVMSPDGIHPTTGTGTTAFATTMVEGLDMLSGG